MDERRLLLAGFAQEVREPLSVVAGHLRVAERCLARVQRVAEDVGVCAALADRSLSLRAEALDLAAFIGGQSPRWVPLYRDLIVHLQLAAALPPVWADAERLAQVLDNLAANVRKHCARQEVTISAQQARDPAQVHIIVADKGPGIPLADRKLVFEPFYRIPRDRLRPGMGLGLYLVRGIVEAHGGKVRIGAGPGCTVHMLWPVAR